VIQSISFAFGSRSDSQKGNYMRLLPFDYAVRNLGRSPTRLVLTILASALVVSLVTAAAAFVRGMGKSLVITSDQSNVILLASGSEESIERSQIPGSTGSIVSADLSGIKTKFSVPYVSPEVHVAIIVRTQKDSKEELRVLIRGFAPEAFLVHPRVHIVEGRIPRPGRDEVMVGGLTAQMMGVSDLRLKVGNTIWFDNRNWTIVGRFRARSTVMDAEMWVPLTDLQVATRRDTLSCVTLTMGEADFGDVDVFTKQRLDLGLTAIQETDYFGSVMRFYKPVHAMIWTTALLVSLAGLLGGVNTMYAAFAVRIREVGTLQALGYSRLAITWSLIQESVLTAFTGALLGVLLSRVFIDGQAVRFSMGVFQLVIDEQVLLVGLIAGLVMGLIGAIPPAWRCLKLPINEALKAA
jgi:putative ABC transport system permease protein